MQNVRRFETVVCLQATGIHGGKFVSCDGCLRLGIQPSSVYFGAEILWQYAGAASTGAKENKHYFKLCDIHQVFPCNNMSDQLCCGHRNKKCARFSKFNDLMNVILRFDRDYKFFDVVFQYHLHTFMD